MTKNISSIFK